jgi:hypothetical protein
MDETVLLKEESKIAVKSIAVKDKRKTEEIYRESLLILKGERP